SIPETLKSHFRPEFLNRIDETIIFNSLGKDQINSIVRVQLKAVEARLKEKRIQVTFSDDAVQFLADRGFDPVYGARPLKRAIQTELLNPLSKEMISGHIKSGNQ